ncbi:hypothetical protein ABK040_014047 [Willaertia magna]
MFESISDFFSTIFFFIPFFRKQSLIEQLLQFDHEIRYYQTRQRKYNVKANSVPKAITRMIIFLCIAVCITIFVYIPTPNAYFIVLSLILSFSFVIYLIKKIITLYYNNNVTNCTIDIEQILLKQKEILEEIKQKNDYYTVNELVKRYETSMFILEQHLIKKKQRNRLKKKGQLTNSLEDEENELFATEVLLTNYPYFPSEILRKYTHQQGNKNTSSSSTTKRNKALGQEGNEEEREMKNISVQTEIRADNPLFQNQQQMLQETVSQMFGMLNLMNRNQQHQHHVGSSSSNRRKIGRTGNNKNNIAIEGEDEEELLSLPAPTLEGNVASSSSSNRSTPTLENSRSRSNSSALKKRSNSFHGKENKENNNEGGSLANTNNINSSSSANSSRSSSIDNDNVNTIVDNNNNTVEELSKEEKVKLVLKQLQSDMIKLRQKENLLRERESKLNQKELQIERKLNQQPLSPNLLYSRELTGRYVYSLKDNNNGFVENRNIVKPGWFDRLLDKVVGQSPENCIALICTRCCSHNGLLMLEDLENQNGFKCWNCGFLNLKDRSMPTPQMSSNSSSPTFVEEDVNSTTSEEEEEIREENGLSNELSKKNSSKGLVTVTTSTQEEK